MSTTGTQSSTRPAIFPVEWPLARITEGDTRQPPVRRETTPKIKRRRIDYRSIIERNQPWPQAPRTAAEYRTQIEDKPQDSDMGATVEYHARGTTTRDVKYEPALPTAAPNIFQSLDHDEASWLVEEVNEANRSIIGAERTAERLRQEGEELDRKKASLSALKSLLNDLRRNIKYPDEEIAKDLDTLDEVSGNFGVRNMVNCLGLLDNYFSELQKQLDK